jgi:hypothetical protein
MEKILQDELVKLAKELCKENYHFGYDIFIECYDIPEWKEFFNNYKVDTIEKLIPALNDQAENWSDTQSNRECFYNCPTEVPNEERGKCDIENTRDNPKEFCDCNFYPSPDPTDLHWQKQERKLSHFHPIPTDQPDYVWE